MVNRFFFMQRANAQSVDGHNVGQFFCITSVEKVDQDYVSLRVIASEAADLLVIGAAQEGSEHSG